jgi:frataxin-like iron-binding protein CyaY
LFPVRRRRGAKRIETTTTTVEDDEDDDDDDDHGRTLQHVPVRDTQKFNRATKDLFDKLERALEPMKSKNEIFDISRQRGELGEIFTLQLSPSVGTYTVEVSEEEHIFEYTSPVSGKILYCLSSTTNQWVGLDDGNAFEGILVRDLIRHCYGLPDL